MLSGGLLSLALVCGLMSAPPATAVDPAATGLGATQRGMVVGFWKSGGPAVRAAAERALTGSDAGVVQFLQTERAAAEYQDDKEAALQVVAQGGRGLREAAERAISGTPQELDAFLKEGWKAPLEQDQVVAATRIANTGGRGVKTAGDAALNGSIKQVKDFLGRVQFEQRDADDLVQVTRIESAGGPSTKRAASMAMNGTIEDVRDFLRFGQQVARAQDQEAATVSQLADQAKSAGQQAEQEATAAKEACAQALSAARLAKEAANKAAEETKLAEGDAARAGEAARRAAEATRRAADAAQTAISAARSANSAARLAAAAAADAANAAAGAARAATRALSAAAAQKVDEGTIHDARSAADKSALAGEWANRAAAAADAVVAMADAVSQVTGNVNDAIKASNDADADAARAGAAAGQSSAAAAAARRYLAEAIRAATAARQWAAAAAQAARDARDAARSAATHARAAADAAAEAAAHAVVGAAATERARIHSEAASTAAAAATAAVDQAKKVYELARKSEAEDVAARTAAGRNQADDLTAAYNAAQAEATKAQTETAKLKDDFAALAARAGQPGADLAQVVTDSRRMAVTAMKLGGSWSRTAAEWALAGSDSAAIAYARTGWQRAQQQDETDEVNLLAIQSPYEAVRKAASQALQGDAARIHTFLETGQHEVALVDYQVEVTRISQAGGPGVKQAGDNAFKAGTAKALVDFITTTQYQGREADDRVLAARLSQTAGPEVKAAAEAAILSPPAVLRAFVQSGQYRAQRQDHLTTTHVTQIQQAIAEADQVAAKAQQNSAVAAEAYAIARDANEAAQAFALEAQNSADRANEASKQAQNWATQAGQSAAKAAESAKAAGQAQQRALISANQASDSATWARASAVSAAGSAATAYAAATAARESAERSGKDADAVVTIFNEALENAKKDEAARQRNERYIAALHEQMYQSLPPLAKGAVIFANLPLQEKLRIALELAHLGADLYGALPIVGIPVSLANCGTYVLEAKIFDDASKYKDAAWSCALTIPIGGWAALGAKLEKWGVKTEKFRGALQGLWNKVGDLGLPACLTRHSFPAGTPVLMADGSSRPIQDVRIGDNLLATEPKTGATGPQRVEATIYTPEDRDFTDLSISAENGSTSTITSTDHHPFWSEKSRAWIDAGDLNPGDTLRTPSGGQALITGARHWKTLQPAYNLTVNSVHTYYVLAGQTPVLVHNADSACVVNSGDRIVLGINRIENSGDALRDALNKADPKANWYTLNSPAWGNPGPAGTGRPLWMDGVEDAAADGSVKISFALDGLLDAEKLEFKSAQAAFDFTYERSKAMAGGNWRLGNESGNQTAWELGTVVRSTISPRSTRTSWDSIQFYWKGKRVDIRDPFLEFRDDL
ncbi:polymorphic toxin-type HINT domain-containing protein [Streptomyces goshikiensis]|uniref:polymorphic toxin-type HINT domain-containing protein n=1 Tax=Streptomyces goshikiensis TaxID=1942 RepID=UPI00382888B1